LSSAVALRIFTNRRRAFGSAIGSGTSHSETRFPAAPYSSARRMLTGTTTRSGSRGTGSPRALSVAPIAPLTAVSTTSLRVPPSRRAIAFTRARST
jgi:hypothetical protein